MSFACQVLLTEARLPQVATFLQVTNGVHMGSAHAVAHAKKKKFVSPKPDDFWAQLGIFPEALDGGDPSFSAVDTAKKSLAGIGKGNLRMLCERAKIPATEDADNSNLALALLSESDPQTILHIVEFLKRRAEWVEKCFSQTFSERQIEQLESSVARHSA